MHVRIRLYSAAAAFGLGACAAPLDVNKSSAPAAAIVGVPASQILFIAYCDFGDVPPGEKHPGHNGGNGFIVLSNDSIYLINGELPNATVKRRIKYRELDG